MKGEAVVGNAPALRCAGRTRTDAQCKGYARYHCTCGRAWCGTHVIRSGSRLTCPVCGQPAKAGSSANG